MDFIALEEKLVSEQLRLSERIKESEQLKSEKLSVSIKSTELLGKGDQFSLPLKVRGKMLGVGRHKIRYYTEEALKQSVLQNKKFPIKLDHRDKEVGSMIGGVDRVYWDDNTKSVMYEGHVNDATQARNLLDGLITDVSATIFAHDVLDMKYGVIGKDLEYDELSFVKDGAFLGNTVEVVS